MWQKFKENERADAKLSKFRQRFNVLPEGDA
jgi:hypothetical protein